MDSSQGQETMSGAGMAGTEKQQKTIADYVGDMVALQSHIEEALDRQLEYVTDHPKASQAVQRFHDMVKTNRDEARAHQERVGSTAGNPVIEAGASIFGKAAGLIDKIRTEGVSKALRDDYTAFNLAAVSYTMLHTTALAFGDQQTAKMAERGLRGYAEAIQQINQLIPDVVIWELEKDDHPVASGVADQVRSTIDGIWKQTEKQSGALA